MKLDIPLPILLSFLSPAVQATVELRGSQQGATQSSSPSFAPSQFASGIDVGACDTFAVMAGTQAACNGASTCPIFGDIGVSPGTSITGDFGVFPADAAFCAADGLKALNDGFAKGGEFGNPLAASEMGGLTFYPGVYTHATAIEIKLANPIVYLDARGDPNAVFIFVAGSTLTTCANSKIVLQGGTKPENVYWALGTALTLGAESVLEGTVLAGTAITIGTHGSIHGRAIAQTAVTCETACTVGFPLVPSLMPSFKPSLMPSSKPSLMPAIFIIKLLRSSMHCPQFSFLAIVNSINACALAATTNSKCTGTEISLSDDPNSNGYLCSCCHEHPTCPGDISRYKSSSRNSVYQYRSCPTIGPSSP